MRRLRYTVELPDGSHREHAPVGFGDAERLLRTRDWTGGPMEGRGAAEGREAVAADAPGDGAGPFLLFLDEGESFFMLLPRDAGYQVSTRVADKWNLLGLMPRQKYFTLEFGLLDSEDALVLLRLFFDDNYPALRALNKEMDWNRPGESGS